MNPLSPNSLIVAGVVLVLAALFLYCAARTSRILAMIAALAGSALLVLGIQPSLARHAITLRLRLVMFSASLFILYITFDRIRHTSLKERYALLWIGTSLGFFLLALFPDLIIAYLQISGMHYTSAIMMLIFVFLLMITFHFSLALSRSEEDRRRIAQETALLEERLRALEKKLAAQAESGKANPHSKPDPP
jgi:hypothetical protein